MEKGRASVVESLFRLLDEDTKMNIFEFIKKWIKNLLWS